MTWADIAVAHLLSGLQDRMGSQILDETKHLAALTHDVINLPNIKKWIETRPKTDVWLISFMCQHSMSKERGQQRIQKIPGFETNVMSCFINYVLFFIIKYAEPNV